MLAEANKFSTIAVEPSELRRYWLFIKRGLEAILAKGPPHKIDWVTEDVYTNLKIGQATCLLSCCEGEPIGFMIYYFAFTPFTNRKEMFIWHTWTLPLRERGNLPVNEAVQRTWNVAYDLARANQCVRIRCLSTRPGFAYFANRFGLEWEHSSYVCEI